MIYLAALSAVAAFIAVFAASLALYFAIQAWTKVQALEKSTHSIQYVPLEDNKKVNKQSDDIDDEIYEGLASRDTVESFEDFQ